MLGAAILLGSAGAAHAGIYTDELSKCLVKSTSAADRIDLVVWIFDAISAHPAVSALSSVTPAHREATGVKAAQLLTRLLLQDCRSQTVEGVKYEGGVAIQQSFSVLGQVAMAGLMSDPAVSKSIAAVATHLDQDKLKALMVEAGQPQVPAQK